MQDAALARMNDLMGKGPGDGSEYGEREKDEEEDKEVLDMCVENSDDEDD